MMEAQHPPRAQRDTSRPNTISQILDTFDAICSLDDLSPFWDMDWAPQMIDQGAAARLHHMQQVRGRQQERNKRFFEMIHSPQRKLHTKRPHQLFSDDAALFAQRPQAPQREDATLSAPAAPTTAPMPNPLLQPRTLNVPLDPSAPTTSSDKEDRGKPKPRVVKKMPVKKTTRAASRAARAASTSFDSISFEQPLEPKSQPTQPAPTPQPKTQPEPTPSQSEPVPEPVHEPVLSPKASELAPAAVPPATTVPPEPVESSDSADATKATDTHDEFQEARSPPISLASPAPKEHANSPPAPAPTVLEETEQEAVPAPEVQSSSGQAGPKPSHESGTQKHSPTSVQEGHAMDLDDLVQVVDSPPAPTTAEQVEANRAECLSQSFATAGSGCHSTASEFDELMDDRDDGNAAEQAVETYAPPTTLRQCSAKAIDLSSDDDSDMESHDVSEAHTKRSLSGTHTIAQDNTQGRNASKSFYQMLLSVAANEEPASPATTGKKRKSWALVEEEPSPEVDAFRPTKKSTGHAPPQGVSLGLVAQHPTNALAALRSRLGAVSAKAGPAPVQRVEPAQAQDQAQSVQPQSPVQAPQSATPTSPFQHLQRVATPGSPAPNSPIPSSPARESKIPAPSPKLDAPTSIESTKQLSGSPASIAPSQFTGGLSPSTPKKVSTGSQGSSTKSIYPSVPLMPSVTAASTPKSKMGNLLRTPSQRSRTTTQTESTTPQTSPKRLAFTRLPRAASPKRTASPIRPASNQATPHGSPSSWGSKIKGLFSGLSGSSASSPQHPVPNKPEMKQFAAQSAVQEQIAQRMAKAVQETTRKMPEEEVRKQIVPPTSQAMHPGQPAEPTQPGQPSVVHREQVRPTPKPTKPIERPASAAGVRPASAAGVRPPSAAGGRPALVGAGKKPVQPPANSVRAKPTTATAAKPTNAAPTKPTNIVSAKPNAGPTRPGLAAQAKPVPVRKPGPASTTAKAVPTTQAKPVQAPVRPAPAPRPPPKTQVTTKPLPAQPKNATSAFCAQHSGRTASATRMGASANAAAQLGKMPSVLSRHPTGRPVPPFVPNTMSVPPPPPVAPSAAAANNFSRDNPFQSTKPVSGPITVHLPSKQGVPSQPPGSFPGEEICSPNSTRDEDIELPEVRSEYSMSDDEETIRRRLLAPDWCKGDNLFATLEAQVDIDTDALFGVPAGNVQLEDIFPSKNNVRRRPRSSSANWTGDDGLKQWEIERYNRRMGIQTGYLGIGSGSASGSGSGSGSGAGAGSGSGSGSGSSQGQGQDQAHGR